MKAVLITGASSGIGYGAAKEFASQGYQVFGSVRKDRNAQVVETQNPKARYAIIPNPIPNWILPSALPDRWLDKLIGRNLGLLPRQ